MSIVKIYKYIFLLLVWTKYTMCVGSSMLIWWAALQSYFWLAVWLDGFVVLSNYSCPWRIREDTFKYRYMKLNCENMWMANTFSCSQHSDTSVGSTNCGLHPSRIHVLWWSHYWNVSATFIKKGSAVNWSPTGVFTLQGSNPLYFVAFYVLYKPLKS